MDSEKRVLRVEILTGIILALDNWPVVGAIVELAADREDAVTMLGAEPLNLTELQAQFVLDTPVGRLTQRGRAQLAAELEKLSDESA